MATKIIRTDADKARVQRVQDMRRSASGPDRNRKRYRRVDAKRAVAREAA